MQRVFFGDNGTLSDNTIEARSSDTIDIVMVAAEDYIYIGSWDPMNSFFVEVDTANTNDSVMSIQYWSNTAWKDAVDILDGTKAAGKTFAQTGIVQFIPDRDLDYFRSDILHVDNFWVSHAQFRPR